MREEEINNESSSWSGCFKRGKSSPSIFKGKPYRKSFKVSHTNEALDSLLHFLNEVENESGMEPTVILESTGHYHAPIIQFLEEHNYLYIMVNPLLSYQAKKSSLRKVKTDAIDAFHLCELYYKEDLEPYKKRGITFKPS